MSLFLWKVLLLISQGYCEVDEYFSAKLDQNLGYKQCQSKCAERRGCTDVDYSSDSLICILRFNLTEIKYFQDRPFCDRHYCTEVMVKTRSKKIHVLELFYDKLLAFKPVIGTTNCKRTGKGGSVFEAYFNVECKLRSVQTLKNNRRYSWVLRISEMNVAGNYGKNVYFCLKKNYHEYGSFYIKKGEYYTHQQKKFMRQRVRKAPNVRLRLILHNNFLRVTHLDDRIDLNPVQFKKNLNDFYAEITLFGRYSCKLVISKGN